MGIQRSFQLFLSGSQLIAPDCSSPRTMIWTHEPCSKFEDYMEWMGLLMGCSVSYLILLLPPCKQAKILTQTDLNHCCGLKKKQNLLSHFRLKSMRNVCDSLSPWRRDWLNRVVYSDKAEGCIHMEITSANWIVMKYKWKEVNKRELLHRCKFPEAQLMHGGRAVGLRAPLHWFVPAEI